MSSILTALEDLETQLDEALTDDPAGLPGAVLAEALERQVRIRNKFAAGCDVPSWRCQIDHLLPFTDHGPTAAENGDPKCGPHNRWKERLDAEIRRRQRWRREHLDPRREPDSSADREEHAA